jgi:NADH:ubiquinone oxidoreductase subunit 6 (subunit J)
MAGRALRLRLALGGLFIVFRESAGKALFSETALTAGKRQHAADCWLCYGQYMFAFEIASLLLLVAIIGAVVMAKKRI